MTEATELTIDELARESGMTARNIRAHQSRGLLPPPTVRARTGYYDGEHLSRIRLIQEMQGQGFNLKAIERLLELNAEGGSEQALAFERSLLTPFGTEQPEILREKDLELAFGVPVDRKLVAKAERIGILRNAGEGVWEVPSPTLWRAGRELGELGIPIEHAIAVAESIDKHTRSIAREFVRLYLKDVLEPLRQDKQVTDADLATAGQAIEKLRPLASEAVLASFGQVMNKAVEKAVEKELGN